MTDSPSLADPVFFVSIPGSAFLDKVVFHTQIHDFSQLGNSFIKKNIEFRLPERRSDFVFDDFDPDPAADHLLPLFDRFDSPDIQPKRRIEF